jgi:glycosyltransferase involved in cell wall biosynthesis
MEPRISIIVPCYNEAGFIKKLLENIIEQDYPRKKSEVYIVDGMSTDGTREIIAGFISEYPFIHFLDNERRYVPFALNKGILASTGEVIVRLDAHSEYPHDYVSRLVTQLYRLNADNVGGAWITLPGDAKVKSLAIATAMASPFGVGNAHYRLTMNEIREVDTVPFGCFRREVFERTGLFDEDLIRNQDDTYNAKLKKNGGKIFLIPDIKIRYYARTSVTSTIKMFYQYGLFKPLGNRKTSRPATLRQLIPPGFVLFTILSLISGLFYKFALLAGISVLALYLIIDLIFASSISVKNNRSALLAYLPWLFFLIHISYGIGYLYGMIKFTILGQKKSSVAHTR